MTTECGGTSAAGLAGPCGGSVAALAPGRFLFTSRGLCCLLLLLAGLVFGLVPPVAGATDVPTFLIETIEIAGLEVDAGREIVAAETRLRPGQSYSESELRDAVHRVERLPFVLAADFALRKGSARGIYQLLVTVKPASRFYYELIADWSESTVNNRTDPAGIDVDWGHASGVGGRWFVGRKGMLFANAFSGILGGGVESLPVQVGYTRWDLLGQGSFATVAVGSDLGEGRFQEDVEVALSLGVPLARNHSLRSTLAWSTRDSGGSIDPLRLFLRQEKLAGELAWSFDTTDDPFFPTNGQRFAAGLEYHRESGEYLVRHPELGDPQRGESDIWGAAASARRIWPLGARNSLGVLGGASWHRRAERLAGSYLGFDGDSTRFDIGLLHSVDLWGRERTQRIGDLRFESRLQVRAIDEPFASLAEALEISTGISFRNDWGIVRLLFTYEDEL